MLENPWEIQFRRSRQRTLTTRYFTLPIYYSLSKFEFSGEDYS